MFCSQTAIVSLLLGIVLLLLGRRQFWFFVGVAGFLVGMDIAKQFVAGPQGTNLLIASEPPLDISDLIKTTGEVLGSAKNAMQSVEFITAKIGQGEGTIGAVINDKRMYNQATAATAQAQAGATAFDENMQALSHNFLLQGFSAEDAGEEGFLIDRVDFLLDPPDFVFIFALQGGVLHRFLQAFLILALHFVKIAIYLIFLSS